MLDGLLYHMVDQPEHLPDRCYERLLHYHAAVNPKGDWVANVVREGDKKISVASHTSPAPDRLELVASIGCITFDLCLLRQLPGRREFGRPRSRAIVAQVDDLTYALVTESEWDANSSCRASRSVPTAKHRDGAYRGVGSARLAPDRGQIFDGLGAGGGDFFAFHLEVIHEERTVIVVIVEGLRGQDGRENRNIGLELYPHERLDDGGSHEVVPVDAAVNDKGCGHDRGEAAGRCQPFCLKRNL